MAKKIFFHFRMAMNLNLLEKRQMVYWETRGEGNLAIKEKKWGRCDWQRIKQQEIWRWSRGGPFRYHPWQRGMVERRGSGMMGRLWAVGYREWGEKRLKGVTATRMQIDDLKICLFLYWPYIHTLIWWAAPLDTDDDFIFNSIKLIPLSLFPALLSRSNFYGNFYFYISLFLTLYGHY